MCGVVEFSKRGSGEGAATFNHQSLNLESSNFRFVYSLRQTFLKNSLRLDFGLFWFGFGVGGFGWGKGLKWALNRFYGVFGGNIGNKGNKIRPQIG